MLYFSIDTGSVDLHEEILHEILQTLLNVKKNPQDNLIHLNDNHLEQTLREWVIIQTNIIKYNPQYPNKHLQLADM